MPSTFFNRIFLPHGHSCRILLLLFHTARMFTCLVLCLYVTVSLFNTDASSFWRNSIDLVTSLGIRDYFKGKHSQSTFRVMGGWCLEYLLIASQLPMVLTMHRHESRDLRQRAVRSKQYNPRRYRLDSAVRVCRSGKFTTWSSNAIMGPSHARLYRARVRTPATEVPRGPTVSTNDPSSNSESTSEPI